MRIEQIKKYINNYNEENGTNFIIYNESKLYTFYHNGYNEVGTVFNNIKELNAYINGYIQALENFKNKNI